MARGGRRAGKPGVVHTQRTDLNGPAPLAPSAPTGQPYGAAGAQLAAQRAVPVGPPGATAPLPSAPAPAPAPQAAPRVLPGQLTPLDAPTERPNEPVTAGAPVGAGPGPEVLGLAPPPPQQLGQVLAQLATANPDLAPLAAWANRGGG